MGYWMGLCIFDYSAFTKTVIPALQAGETHPLVNRTIELLLISMQDLPVQTEAPYPPDSPTFQQLYKDCGSRELYERHWNKLDTFRRIVKMAVDLKYGLLWGRDLGLFYGSTLFHNCENIPVDLRDILDTKKYDLSPSQ